MDLEESISEALRDALKSLKFADLLSVDGARRRGAKGRKGVTKNMEDAKVCWDDRDSSSRSSTWLYVTVMGLVGLRLRLLPL